MDHVQRISFIVIDYDISYLLSLRFLAEDLTNIALSKEDNLARTYGKLNYHTEEMFKDSSSTINDNFIWEQCVLYYQDKFNDYV